MNAEGVARRFTRRPGFELVSYRQVALPVFRLALRVLLLETKHVPPISEFIMKSIDAGVGNRIEIAGLLGLEQGIVDAGIVSLIANDDLLNSRDALGNHCLLLSPKGRKTLSELKTTLPSETTIHITVDGLTRTIVKEDRYYLKPKELQQNELIEIAPHPRHKPTIDELNVEELRSYLKTIQVSRPMLSATSQGKVVAPTLIAVLGVERAERFFRDDVLALIYRGSHNAEVQIGFAISEQLSPEHEQAFRQSKQGEKLGLEQEGFAMAQLLRPEVVALAQEQSPESTDGLAIDVERAVAEVEQVTQKLNSTTSLSERKSLEQQLQLKMEARQRLEASLQDILVRNLQVYDHPEYLEDALDRSNERLMIISPWITASVVDSQFVGRLRKAVARGVAVYIGYGIGGKDEKPQTARDAEALKSLEKLAEAEENFHLVRLGDTHAKILVSDQRYVIIGSFNWLSFKGERKLRFRDERSVYVAMPEQIEEVFVSYVSRFGSGVAVRLTTKS